MLRLRRHKSVSDPVVVVNRFVDAANRHDAEGIARCLHPDFESIQPVYPARNFTGSDQVKRNWQAIFQSEPGFRLSLIRSSASEGTVWVELHGAGSSVEVAGVFIMGVEDDLVRWARVYSSVIEQAAPEMEEAVKAPTAAVTEPTVQDEAEELRRMIEAGREAAGLSVEAESTDTADGAENTDEEDEDEDRAAEEQEAGEGEGEGEDDGEGEGASGDEDEDEEAEEDVAPVEDGPTTEEAGAPEEPFADGTAEAVSVEAGGDDAGPVKDDPAPVDVGSTEQDRTVERPEVQAGVAEVLALAEMTRPKRSRNRRRTTRIGEGDSKPDSEPPAEPAGKDDAARVRAAARAATSKAAAKSSDRKPRDNKKN